MVFQFDFEKPLEIVPQDQFSMVIDFHAFAEGVPPQHVIEKSMMKQIPRD